MSAGAASPAGPAFLASAARFTRALFALVPPSLALLVLRLTLARPFFASGLTRWDGWFSLSFGTKVLFADEYRLHILGREIAFPAPELVATLWPARPRSSSRFSSPSGCSPATRRSACSR